MFTYNFVSPVLRGCGLSQRWNLRLITARRILFSAHILLFTHHANQLFVVVYHKDLQNKMFVLIPVNSDWHGIWMAKLTPQTSAACSWYSLAVTCEPKLGVNQTGLSDRRAGLLPFSSFSQNCLESASCLAQEWPVLTEASVLYALGFIRSLFCCYSWSY